ncbi:MAG: DUF445 family protein [Clostridiales bacterium]|nr:DUF445 family protein [Clostridiales bacterium]
MEYLSLLFVPLVGAVIGYSTNMLAITMLFRPHHEIRLFGRRLPFTPGLVPRQQKQLAQKMSASLAENVLTSQALAEAASNTGIVDGIVKMIQGFADNIIESDEAISKILADVLKRDEGELVDWLTQNSERLTSKIIGALREYAENTAMPYLQSEDFARLLTDFARTSLASAQSSDKKLSDVVPAGVVSAVKSAAKDNMHRLAPACRKLLEDERVDARLRELVGKIAKESTGGILGLFVNADKIYESIVKNLLEYLDDLENHALIYEKLTAFVDGIMERELGWLVGWLNREKTENCMAAGVAAMQRNLRQEHVSKIFDGISRASDVKRAAHSLLSLTPSQIIPKGAEYKASVDKLVRNAVTMLAQKAGRHIVGALDVAKIAQERINAFESREIERLVKNVAGVQLKWIVRLGGLLGFIMGFFPAVFNLLI